jgi:tetratricopeptide (TPR) repeat protein
MNSEEKKIPSGYMRITVVVMIIIATLAIFLYKPYYFEGNPMKLMNIGIYYHSKDNYKDAAVAFEKALQKKSTSELHTYYANTLFHLKDYDKAYDHIKKALELDPKNADAILALAEYYRVKEKDTNAIENYELAIKYKPTAEAYFKYGRYHYNMGHTEEAYENLTKSLDLDAEYLELYPYLAEVYTRKGLFVSAFDAYEFYFNQKLMQGIPYSFLMTKEADEIKKKLRLLRDMAGEA